MPTIEFIAQIARLTKDRDELRAHLDAYKKFYEDMSYAWSGKDGTFRISMPHFNRAFEDLEAFLAPAEKSGHQ